jgi:serine/threonine protein kinase
VPGRNPRHPTRSQSEPPHVGYYEPKTLHAEQQRHRRLPPAECIRIGLALTEALAHLHRHGLVHRDVKPANIIFVGGVAKLADIGLVAEVSEARSYVGTEGFIPPEGPGSPQADLYSLGKLLYEISTGQDRHAFPALPPDLFCGNARLPQAESGAPPDSPHQSRSSRREEAQSSKSEIRNAKSEIDLSEPLSPAEAQQLVELNAILLKACQPDPRARYQSADAMHAELELLQRGESVRRRRLVQHRFAVARRVAVAAALVTVLALGAWTSARRTRSSPGCHITGFQPCRV